MKDKFASLTAPVISQKRQEQIISAIEGLDDIADVRDLAELLAAE